jgi:hypothetical protein
MDVLRDNEVYKLSLATSSNWNPAPRTPRAVLARLVGRDDALASVNNFMF